LSSEDKDRVIEEWKKRIPDFVEYIKVHTDQGKKPPISPEVVSAISVVYLYESSKKIESYSKALKWLTVALVALTTVLAIRTLLP
jgi:hypothetical protein